LVHWPNYVTRDTPHGIVSTIHDSSEPRPATTTPMQSIPSAVVKNEVNPSTRLDEYTTPDSLDKAINQQVIKAITDPIFLKPLENRISGYSRVRARALIQFLFNACGNTTQLQLETNDKMMKEQWDAYTPIIYLFSKIQEGVGKADASNTPYTVNKVLAITFNHVFRTSIMQSACERWTSLAQMNKMWSNFQDMFTLAHETCKSLTAQSGRYHGANMAQVGHYNAAPNTPTPRIFK
jgi:hypothetical protein